MTEFKDWSAADQDSWQQRYKQGKYAEPSPTAAPTAVPASSTPPPIAPAAPAAPAAPGAPAPPPATIPDAFRTSLVSALNRGNATPTLDDPTIKAQSDAYAVGQTRAREQARAAMAERMAHDGAPGVNSGAFNDGLAGLYQQQGEAVGANNAKLLGNEAQARKQELLQAAAIAGNTLNAEQSRALQQQLAELDAQIRREGIAQQGSLGQGDLQLRGRLGEGQLNLGLLGALLNNQQFGQQLQQQGNQFGQSLDTSTILGLLGQF